MDIRALKREGHSIKRIAAMTGRSEQEIVPRWHVRFDAPVAAASLAAFDEVAV